MCKICNMTDLDHSRAAIQRIDQVIAGSNMPRQGHIQLQADVQLLTQLVAEVEMGRHTLAAQAAEAEATSEIDEDPPTE